MKRVIGDLRKGCPGAWRYDFLYWRHESGVYVVPTAVPAPRYDGDDDSFASYLYAYRDDGAYVAHKPRCLARVLAREVCRYLEDAP